MTTKPPIVVSVTLTPANLAHVDELYRRRRGDFRTLVLRALSEGRDPEPDDLASALEQPAPEPRVRFAQDPKQYPEAFAAAVREAEQAIADDTKRIIKYVATRYLLGTKPLSPGRKTAPNAARAEKKRQIIVDYFASLQHAIDAYEADSRAPRNVAARARAATAKKHRCSERDVSRAIRGLSLAPLSPVDKKN
jgi:hypothetical protein